MYCTNIYIATTTRPRRDRSSLHWDGRAEAGTARAELRAFTRYVPDCNAASPFLQALVPPPLGFVSVGTAFGMVEMGLARVGRTLGDKSFFSWPQSRMPPAQDSLSTGTPLWIRRSLLPDFKGILLHLLATITIAASAGPIYRLRQLRWIRRRLLQAPKSDKGRRRLLLAGIAVAATARTAYPLEGVSWIQQ